MTDHDGAERYNVTVRKAADVLGVHENTIRNWAKSGRLPSQQLPGSGFHRFRLSDLVTIREAMETPPSYHDLHITADNTPRTSIFDLPYGMHVTCNRVGGWEVWNTHGSADPNRWVLVGGEYNAEPEDNEEGRPIRGGLRLDVAGFVIVDSLSTQPERTA